MNRKPFRVVIAISVVVVALVAGLLHYRRVHAERAFSRDLASAALSGRPTVHLRSISSPVWERVYIFGPYTSSDQISAALGFAWTSSDVDALAISAGNNLLVFVSHQRVVMSVLHPRNQGDFVPDSVDANYARDDAEFSVVRRPQDNWLLFTPVANSRGAPNQALQASGRRSAL